MDLGKRIENIKPYFKVFNIAEGVAYIITSFPDKWMISDICNDIEKVEYKYDGDKKVYYFFTEIENGTDVLFDAVDKVIEYNKALQEKVDLLKIKGKELSDLFASEPLEKLKTLKFTFDSKKSNRGKKKAIPEAVEEKKSETEATIYEEPDEIPSSNSGLMEFAEKIVNE